MDIAEVVNEHLPRMQDLMHLGHVVFAQLDGISIDQQFVVGSTYDGADHYMLVELKPDFRNLVDSSFSRLENIENRGFPRQENDVTEYFKKTAIPRSPRYVVSVRNLDHEGELLTYTAHQEMFGLAGAGNAANLYTYLAGEGMLPAERDFTYMNAKLQFRSLWTATQLTDVMRKEPKAAAGFGQYSMPSGYIHK